MISLPRTLPATDSYSKVSLRKNVPRCVSRASALPRHHYSKMLFRSQHALDFEMPDGKIPKKADIMARSASVPPNDGEPANFALQEPSTTPQEIFNELVTGAVDQIAGHDLPEEALGDYDEVTIDDEGTCTAIVRIANNFTAEEGLKLTEDLAVGKLLGGGVQGAVYKLVDGAGQETKKLLKVIKYKVAKPVFGLDVGLKREWLIGQNLNKLMGANGEIEGFMATHEAVVTEAGALEGLVIEKLNGWPLEKRITPDDDRFNNIHYVLEMLHQVFRALDVAYRKLGFVHHDMRIANVMEHRKDAPYLPPKGFMDKKERKKLMKEESIFKLDNDEAAQKLEFKIIDYGHARLRGGKANQPLPSVPVIERAYRKWFEGKGDVWRLLQDMTDVIDGRTWPAQDEKEVRVLLALVRHVTGNELTAFYRKPDGETYPNGAPWQRINGWGHKLRRIVLRLRAYLFPKNTEYSSREALQYLSKLEKKHL